MPVKTNVKISTLGYVMVYVKDTKGLRSILSRHTRNDA